MSYRLADAIRGFDGRGGASLVDILPTIKSTCKDDMAIMERWLAHFRAADVPFAVTRKGTKYTVWKRRAL